jgi:DNA polymerase-4
MRTACVHIPHLYLQIEYLRKPALESRPVVIVSMPDKKGYVLDCSEELIQRGVKPSMPLKDVYPLLCFETIPIFARRADYKLLHEEILSAVAGIALRIESAEPDTLFIDISRLPGMYKSEENLAYALVSLITDKFHLKANVGVGNCRLLALEAALCAKEDVLVIRPGSERQFLSPLGIDRLPLAGDILERLHMLGIHTLGQVGAFTLTALTSQFGATGRVLWEVANGIEEQDRIPCAFTVTDIDEEIVCDGPVYSREQIRTTLLDLLDVLCAELEDLKKACRAIHLVFDLENKTFLERQFVFHSATACKQNMLRRVMAGIERLELTSPIRIMSVRASSLEPSTGKQDGLFRARSGLSKEIKDISGFLKTKYGTMPVARAVKNNSNSFLPDEQFIFVEP